MSAQNDAATVHPERAHSVMHNNLNCSDVAESAAFYSELFGVENRMHSISTDTDGRAMGLGEHTASETAFLYDGRGPRSAPALELVEWHEPKLLPRDDLGEVTVGFASVGYRVATLEGIGLAGTPGKAVVRGQNRKSVQFLDPDGVVVEVVEIEPAEQDPPRGALSHERIVVTDLERSLAWYERIGFVVRPDEVGVVRANPGASLYLPEDPTFSFELECVPTAPKVDTVANTQGLYRVALAVEDVRAAYAALVKLDPTTPAPSFIPMADVPTGGFTVLFYADPDDLVVEFVDRPRAEVRRPLEPV